MVAPLDPYVRSFADRIEVDRVNGTIVVVRREATVLMRVGTDASVKADGTIYVKLAQLVRGLGGTVRFDAVRKVLAIDMPGPGPVVSPTPFDPNSPSAPPRRVFTPQPVVTPRPVLSGIPIPRRTPIPVAPSYP